MKIADDPNVDYKALVRGGYNQCANDYHESRSAEPGPELDILLDRLADDASVLDIGCGAGVPVTRALSKRCGVTGVDISEAMIELARANVPSGRFIHGDVMSLEFEPAAFDAATAFYSIFHIPREEHQTLFERVHRWLRPGGYLLCTLTYRGEPAYTEDDFFGVTMHWSNYGLFEYRRILANAGFDLLNSGEAGHGFDQRIQNPSERHPIVFARKRKAPQ